MAWRSSGTTNDEMVNNLKRFQVISSSVVESGFRNVDRRFFVPENRQSIAHSDQPIKEGNVHISAPHIYGSVLEALDLRNDTAFSFLNAGSGTCYLTCIAASILGPRSVHYCIEVHDDVIEHAKAAITRWKEASSTPAQNICNIDILHGNALELDTDKGECALGFDRIYVGAAIDKKDLSKFKKLLKPGGILVGPVEDELVKVIRVQTPSSERSGQEFTMQVISGVHFAALAPHPSMKVMIPARVWNPSRHHFYPDSFRSACKEVLLCSNASTDQPFKPVRKESLNAASLLPRALWMEILSYTHRDWFECPMDELEFLRRRLAEEQANAERANEARLDAETRCHLAEKERDVYRILAMRWRSRVNASSSSSSGDRTEDNESIEEAAAAVLFGGRVSLSVLGLGNIFRQIRNRTTVSQNGQHNDELEIDHDDDVSEQDTVDRMDDDEDDDDDDEEDGDVMNEAMEADDSNNREEVDDDDDDEDDDDDDDSLSMGSDHRISMIDTESSQSKNLRPQVRTVSLAEGDF